MTPSGVAEADPVGFQTYRSQLGAQHVKVIAEVDSMHFQWMGSKATPEVAQLAQRAGADAVEVAHPDEATNAQLVTRYQGSHACTTGVFGRLY